MGASPNAGRSATISQCFCNSVRFVHRDRPYNAYGSGGRQPNLANLSGLPACTRSTLSRAAKIIPYIFRIMGLLGSRLSAVQAGHIPELPRWASVQRCRRLPSAAVGRRCCCQRRR
jgi:hypothetical protein